MTNVITVESFSIHLAPPDWAKERRNPFTTDGEYGMGWSCCQFCDWDDDRRCYGRTPQGLFWFGLGRQVPDAKARLADFIRYESLNGRRVIFSCHAGTDPAQVVRRSLLANPGGVILRQDDPNHLVHSTPLAAWPSIVGCGRLKSSAALRRAGQTSGGVGMREFGEPPDYAEYVMLGLVDHIAPEIVAASQELGRPMYDENAAYSPGVRLYLDAHRIIRDGLAVRDGMHTLKVRDELPLKPYLMAAISASDLLSNGETVQWTPRRFLDRANAFFVANSAQRIQGM